MSSKPKTDSVFTPDFMTQLAQGDIGDSTDAAVEAASAGPWVIRELPGPRWAVVAEGEEPALVAGAYDTALIAAAVLSGTGRTPLVRILDQPRPEGYPLVSVRGDELALARHFQGDLAAGMHLIEHLRRSPVELARVMAAARGSALERAGRLLWLWGQAPPHPR